MAVKQELPIVKGQDARSPRVGTILVAVADPSAQQQSAVHRAAEVAAAFGARLILFHAAFEPSLSGRPFFNSKRLAKSRGWLVAERTQQLDRCALKLRAGGLIVDTCAVWEEPAHEAVIRAVLREKADLVVAGRHVRRGDRPFQLRLTDWELMRLCPRPLLLVQAAPQTSGGGSVLAALDPTHANDKPASLDIDIANHAARLAQALQLALHAVHCVPQSAYPLGEISPADRRRMRHRASARLRRVVKKSGASFAAVHVLDGSVAESVPALARKLSAQVIAMGIISRRWMKHFAVGDTAESVIRNAPCDILLIKPENIRLRLGRSHKEAIVLPKEK
jgi:universal stress protein E